MKASYELTADDLVAFTLFHNSTSPVVRRQRTGCLIGAVLLLLALPTLILTTSDKPIAETAKDIWPLLAGPVLFVVFHNLVSEMEDRKPVTASTSRRNQCRLLWAMYAVAG
jgi:hypothetical protein